MAYRKGLDGRARDKSGRVREKNGTALVKNMIKEHPELRAFTPDATLTNLKRRYGVSSLDELRKVARTRSRSR